MAETVWEFNDLFVDQKKLFERNKIYKVDFRRLLYHFMKKDFDVRSPLTISFYTFYPTLSLSFIVLIINMYQRYCFV